MIVGAPKAGTTALFEYLRTHPQIFMPAQKETSFFLRHFDHGWEWYVDTFLATAGPGQICGESTGYMSGTPHVAATMRAVDSSWYEEPVEQLARVVPRRIHALLPDVKL